MLSKLRSLKARASDESQAYKGSESLPERRRSKDERPTPDGMRRSSQSLSSGSGTYGDRASTPSLLRERSDDRYTDPLGLITLYVPETTPSVDIIFVHGLGGTSRRTWSKHHDPQFFWPLEWLPSEDLVNGARIFSFGYNATVMSQDGPTVLNTSDFAKSLLFDMRFKKGEDGMNAGIGKYPIIFVAHSFGGLVFKQAYIYGQIDDDYKDIVASIRGVVFLSTPHRGSNLADYLNRILSVSLIHSPKQYITEIGKTTPYLEQLNDQFRNVAPNLRIFSFYETCYTPVGLKQMLILNKESAILGYPEETSSPLTADHHNVCKFTSPEDPNYAAVVSVLSSLVYNLSNEDTAVQKERATLELQNLASFLSVSQPPEDDLNFFISRWNPSTCEWILRTQEYQNWTISSPGSSILWLHGSPARGKSVLSSYIVNKLQDSGVSVQYFFFRYGDETKRSIGSLLRSLAFQLSVQLPDYRRRLAGAAGSGVKLKDSDWRSMWQKLFVSQLFSSSLESPVYWVIDGLDEAESPSSILTTLSSITSSSVPIRVLAVSRRTTTISSSFERLNADLPKYSISADEDTTDLEIYSEERLIESSWPSHLKSDVMKSVMRRANGNFLWVHLALTEIENRHTRDDIMDSLDQLPDGMESLYKRMEESICPNRRGLDLDLTRRIFLWVIYSRRHVAVDELSQILGAEFGSIVDMRRTLGGLCGHFVLVDNAGNISLIHQTARDYLLSSESLPFSLKSDVAHREIFTKSVSAFMKPKLRSELDRALDPTTLRYRATSWAYHLSRTPISKDDDLLLDQLLDLLVRFFNNSYVFLWIQTLASINELKSLVDTSDRLGKFVRKVRKIDAGREPLQRRLTDFDTIQAWSRDLVKIVAKFGSNLLAQPTAIFDCIAAFCPRGSAIHKSSSKLSTSPLRIINGLPDDWDDCLARVSVGDANQASMLTCSDRYLALLVTDGNINLWDCTTFEEIRTIQHGAPVHAMCFSSTGALMASSGSQATKIWDTFTGGLLYSIPGNRNDKPMSIVFAEHDTVLLMGSTRNQVSSVSLAHASDGWKVVDPSLLNTAEPIKGTNLNSPTTLSFSPDRTKIAASYRRYPLTIWSIDPARVEKRVYRGGQSQGKSKNQDSFVDQVRWHPNSDEILGIFFDGCVFKDNILEGHHQEIEPEGGVAPSDIRCSPDGLVFATCDLAGTIKIYDYETFALIYRLSSEDMIMTMCFSSDSRRLYDIRGNHCNIWEPNALTKISEVEERSIEGLSEDGSMAQSNTVSEAFVDRPVPITTLAASSKGSLVCTGNDEGVVRFHDYNTGNKLEIGKSPVELCIEEMTWSTECKHFVFAEITGRFNLLSYEGSADDQPRHRFQLLKRFDPDLEPGGIKQLLLRSDGLLLLIAFAKTTQIYSAESCSSLATLTYDRAGVSRKWMAHPHSGDKLLSITATEITAHQWTDLSESNKWAIVTNSFNTEKTAPESPVGKSASSTNSGSLRIEKTIEQAFVTHSNAHILVTVSQKEPRGKYAVKAMVIDMTFLKADGGEARQIPIPTDVAAQIRWPLNILGHDRLVFIDRRLWVCTWRLGSSTSAKRHFFLPMDWITDESLRLIHVTEEGTILCPKGGELAVIETSLASEW